MSDRQPDQGSPLFPRRTLSGPAAPPASSGGPPTENMPRVDDRPAPSGQQQARGSTLVDAPSGSRQAPTAKPAGPSTGGPTTPATTQARPESREQPSPKPGRASRKQPRRARLRAVRLDPWSVMKMAFALSIALAIVTVVAVFIVWTVLDSAGVWDSINSSVDTVVDADGGEGFDIQQWVGRGRVMGVTLLVSVANVVLLTALATLAAFVYNLAAALLGGFEVTLVEDR